MNDKLIQRLARKLDTRIKSIDGPTLKYLNEFFSLKAAPDISATYAFPNAKEITESFAAYNAARKYLKSNFNLSDDSISLIAVGDGASPRTAITFAFRSKWKCYSVDPKLKLASRYTRIDRLKLYPNKIEDFKLTCDKAVIIAVHSHAKLSDAINSITANKKAVIAIPCCKEQVLNQDPDHIYLDWGIHSPERIIKIWTNIDRI